MRQPDSSVPSDGDLLRGDCEETWAPSTTAGENDLFFLTDT